MVSSILEWTENYLRYKDSVHRRMSSLQKESDTLLVCTNKTGDVHNYLCVNELSSLNPLEIQDYRVSCLNTKKNLDWLIKNWDVLKQSSVVFLFSNPDKAVHWSVTPKVHDSIAEKSAIKPGLTSLFESIPEV